MFDAMIHSFVRPLTQSDYYAGNLSKWTNYLHGWQDRYIVLRDGTLSYYKRLAKSDWSERVGKMTD